MSKRDPSRMTLTPRRIQALQFIKDHPRTRADWLAEKVLPRLHGGRYTQQGATRVGAGYAVGLKKMGLITVHSYTADGHYVESGFGELAITEAGVAALEGSKKSEDNLDTVLARCVDP